MPFRQTDEDVSFLVGVAEHRVLTRGQTARLLGRNLAALGRRLPALEAAGLVRTVVRGFRARRGRPEGLVSLAEKGVELLKEKGCLKPEVPARRVLSVEPQETEHQLLTNEFRVQLEEMVRRAPVLSVQFLSANSPFLARSAGDDPVVRERFRASGTADEWVEFTPDGVFRLTHSELRKTLLFFLEVDRGTEPVTTSKGTREAICRKIANYQAYCTAGRYKRYEGMWNCTLKQFRLLLLTQTATGLAALCRLVQQMDGTGFVWLTDEQRLKSAGVWGAIWARGRGFRGQPQSILGSQAPILLPSLGPP